jgi:hypothetical protein
VVSGRFACRPPAREKLSAAFGLALAVAVASPPRLTKELIPGTLRAFVARVK